MVDNVGSESLECAGNVISVGAAVLGIIGGYNIGDVE